MLDDEKANNKPRHRIAVSYILALTIGLGIASRELESWLPEFVVANSGDALWTVAVFLTLALLFPSWSPLRLGLVAFAISVLVETSQLIDLAWLNALRGHRVGRLFLGSGFLWADIVRYFAGAILATTIDWRWISARREVDPSKMNIRQRQ